ncbi:hypothetical protein L1275_001574 [Flavobacterium sp. HSC-61S13]|nr:hypothetical protein [Flavobacterium sp. HSC-61S13]
MFHKGWRDNPQIGENKPDPKGFRQFQSFENLKTLINSQ